MLKTIIFSLFLINSFLYAKINAVVSILPEISFVKAIGGDLVNVSVMVQPGAEPETYAPKPTQMGELARANIYFAIGIEFEDAWLPRFANQNPNMLIVHVEKGIKKEAMPTFRGKIPTQGQKDPHVWMSPKNIKIIAKNIFDTLAKQDSKNRLIYEKNYKKFILHVEKIDAKIRDILKNSPKNSKFMVFHPAWGYFAKEYHLVQLPIQVEGKAPTPKGLIRIIKIAKSDHIKAIFTQPEFSHKVADKLAEQLHIKVIKATPLDPNWEENLIKFARAIAG